MSYWLVGEAPNPEVAATPALWLMPDSSGIPHTANRLLSFTGWTRAEFLRVFDHRTNVWTSPWPLWLDYGRRRAEQIGRQASGSDGVVILGARAATAFGLDGEPHFEWVGRFALVPHPSGRCRYWNHPGTRERAREFFGEMLEGVHHK